MSEPILNVLKIMLLAGLYLFFLRVLWSVFSELRDPRTVVRKPAKPAKQVTRAPQPVPAQSPSGQTPAGLAMQPVMASAGTGPGNGGLVVLEPAEHRGAHFTLGSDITIGRALTNGIVLDDTFVSTVHARIFETDGTYYIEDLSSRNGSLLNGARIAATTALAKGDRVQIGATMMEFS